MDARTEAPSAAPPAVAVHRHSFWKSFGPGLLWAAAAIGVSHLVQSTRAGADAGFALAFVVLLALVLKYPFFEYGPRYAAATGRSLVEGYHAIGRWALWLYLGITLATALIIQTVIVLFTAFLTKAAFGLDWSLTTTAAVILLASGALLWVGRYRLLDRTIKGVLILLALSTLAATLVVLPQADFSSAALWPGEAVPFIFVLALVGWMPSAIDISVWSSLWTLAKDGEAGQRTTVRAAKLDFLIGYVGTGVLAFAFLTLGAVVMHGAGESLSPQGTVFSVQLVDLYAQTLGPWSRPLMMAAVLTTMFSTSLTVMDGFPRAIDRSIAVLRSGVRVPQRADPVTRAYLLSLLTLGALTVAVIATLTRSLTAMVDFATTVSFVTAPVLGYLNLRAVTSSEMAPEHRPGSGMRLLSYVGLLLLGGTAVVYLTSLLL